MKKISRTRAKRYAPVLVRRTPVKRAGQEPLCYMILNSSEEPMQFRYAVARAAKALQQLCTTLEVERLYFLPEFPSPWLRQENSYPPIRSALAYFRTRGIGRRFDGLIEVPLGELREFIPQLGWLIRSNSTGEINFCDPNGRMVLSLCKYGNIHASYERSFERRFKNAVAIAGFIQGHDCLR